MIEKLNTDGCPNGCPLKDKINEIIRRLLKDNLNINN